MEGAPQRRQQQTADRRRRTSGKTVLATIGEHAIKHSRIECPTLHSPMQDPTGDNTTRGGKTAGGRMEHYGSMTAIWLSSVQGRKELQGHIRNSRLELHSCQHRTALDKNIHFYY